MVKSRKNPEDDDEADDMGPLQAPRRIMSKGMSNHQRTPPTTTTTTTTTASKKKPPPPSSSSSSSSKAPPLRGGSPNHDSGLRKPGVADSVTKPTSAEAGRPSNGRMNGTASTGLLAAAAAATDSAVVNSNDKKKKASGKSRKGPSTSSNVLAGPLRTGAGAPQQNSNKNEKKRASNSKSKPSKQTGQRDKVKTTRTTTGTSANDMSDEMMRAKKQEIRPVRAAVPGAVAHNNNATPAATDNDAKKKARPGGSASVPGAVAYGAKDNGTRNGHGVARAAGTTADDDAKIKARSGGAVAAVRPGAVSYNNNNNDAAAATTRARSRQNDVEAMDLQAKKKEAAAGRRYNNAAAAGANAIPGASYAIPQQDQEQESSPRASPTHLRDPSNPRADMTSSSKDQSSFVQDVLDGRSYGNDTIESSSTVHFDAEGNDVDAMTMNDDHQYATEEVYAVPIAAELSPEYDDEGDVAQRVADRLQAEMAERLEREVADRLQKERQTQVVAEAVRMSQSDILSDENGGRSFHDEDDDEDTILGMKSDYFLILACVLFCVVVGGAVGILFGIGVLGGGDDGGAVLTLRPTSSPTLVRSESPSSQPTTSPTRFITESFKELLQEIGPIVSRDVSIFDDVTTPQFAALDWLANNDSWSYEQEFDDTAMEESLERQMLVERYSLALLYYANGGDGWRNSYNFLSNSSVCLWHDEDDDDEESGVYCTNYDGVLSDLTPIPDDSINDVTSVKQLRLANNAVRGNLPTEFALLSKLQIIDMDENFLIGTIPWKEYGFTLSNLARFWMDGNSLSGIISADIQHLSSLASLDLNGNSIGGSLPTEMGTFTNLYYFTATENNIRGTIPTELGNLSNSLNHLDLFGNILTGTIPTQLGQLTLIEYFFFEENQLVGTIPTELGRLSSSIRFFLSENNLSGPLPTELGRLSNVQLFFLFENELTGTVPTEWSSMTALQQLSMEGNFLSGSVDEIFCVRMPPITTFWMDCLETITANGVVDDTTAVVIPAEVTCTCCTDCCDANNVCESV